MFQSVESRMQLLLALILTNSVSRRMLVPKTVLDLELVREPLVNAGQAEQGQIAHKNNVIS